MVETIAPGASRFHRRKCQAHKEHGSHTETETADCHPTQHQADTHDGHPGQQLILSKKAQKKGRTLPQWWKGTSPETRR